MVIVQPTPFRVVLNASKDVHDGIALIWVEINKRGYASVKADQDVQAWIMAHEDECRAIIAAKKV